MSSRLRIGDVAALFDVTTKTLRHYEKLGLLNPEREENGYRLFGPEDVLRVQRIRQLQSLGLSLKEVERLLSDDDELLWADVLRSLRQEAAAEIELLQERMDHIEHLLSEGLPPDQESLPASSDKVNEYLEQHLPVASLDGWRRDTRIYASLLTSLGSPAEGPDGSACAGSSYWRFAPLLPGQPLMIPGGLDEPYAPWLTLKSAYNGHEERYVDVDRQRSLLQRLQKYERLIAAGEDEER